MNYAFPRQHRDEAEDGVRPEPPRGAARQAGLDHQVGLEHIDMRAAGAEDGARSIVGETIAVIKRRYLGLSIWLLACVTMASGYVLTARPEFSSTAQVVLEPRQEVPVGSNPSAASLAPALDSAQAESQMQVIKSGRNLRYVFDTQNLASNPAYADQPPGLIKGLIGSLTSMIPGLKREELPPEEKERIARESAFQKFADTVTVKRLGQSYVMEVSVRALTPKDAVMLANAVMMAYIRDQVLVRAASEQRRSDFLQNRISIIQSEKLVATKAVAEGIVPDFQFPDSDARVVSAALEPLTKAYPQTKLILLLAGIFGVVTGVGAVTIHQSLDRTIRSREQVRRVLGFDCLGAFPRMRGWRGKDKLSYRFVLDRPDTEFADTLRVLRTSLFAASRSGQGISIGIVSCVSCEGRSTIAANLAHLRAVSGDRVVLIDADLRNPAMSRLLAPSAPRGLNEMLLGREAEDGETAALPETEIAPGLAFVPAVRGGRDCDPNVFLGSHVMQDALARSDRDRDIVVDLPALSDSSDAQAVGRLLDGVILVAAVNRTSLDELSEAVRALQAADVRLLGIVLNDVEPVRKANRRPSVRASIAEIAQSRGQAE